MADDRENGHFLGLNREDAIFARQTVGKLTFTAVAWPLQCVKTLIQLGYEPFPLSSGRKYVCVGRNTQFLPNVFSYGVQLATRHGFSILFTGWDAASLARITFIITHRYTFEFLDKHYPEMGGAEDVSPYVEEENLTDHQSFKRHLRDAIRDGVVTTVGTVLSCPFTVVAVRQIGQIVGNEMKYRSVFSSLKLIGDEEGLAGLFSGLVPRLIRNYMIDFGIHALGYVAARSLVHAGFYEKQDEKSRKRAKNLRKVLNIAVMCVVNSWSYPYAVVSSIMAVAGSGLTVSVLPHSPSFGAWQNAFDYLSTSELKRGYKFFFRESNSAVSIGSDQQLYAYNMQLV